MRYLSLLIKNVNRHLKSMAFLCFIFTISCSFATLPKDITMCYGQAASQGIVSAKAHTGTVNTPVGSNIGGLRRWSSNSTWNGETKPAAGDDVTIPENAVVVLDQNVNVKSITVHGKLIVDLSKNININVEYIMVMGSNAYFEWGTEAEPYNQAGVITLVGNDPNKKIPNTNEVESKAIMVMNNATMEMHGKDKVSWSKLDANASAGSHQITIADNNANWSVGDEILIAPSRTNWNEGEKRTITSVNGKTLTLNAGLNHPHIGNVHTYTRQTDGKTWTGDMRTEVGMLSKAIKIQGDNTSDGNQFGGHVMIHRNGVAHVENVEFYRMGQKSKLGRYPFHWHLVEERGAGQYLKDCSIHRSYNRAITIHGTESTLVENNFCYDHIGHGLFLEDGSERFNVIRGNVVLLTKRPAAGEEITPSDNEMNEVQNRTPASYWITNPNNTFENNVAAGTQGTGFWFAMPTSPMGSSANLPRFQGLQPHRQPLGKFSGNTAHSCKSGFDIFDQLRANHSIQRNAPWQRTDKRYMDNCTWYACDLAVYGGIGGGRNLTEGVVFRNNVFLDNVTSVMHANYAVIEESVFIANSGENVFNGERMLNRGYDGSCTIKECHLVGWQASNANYVQNTGGANKHVNYRITGMTMDHPGPPRMSFPNYNRTPSGNVGANSIFHPRFWSYIHWDMDGSFSGKANTSIVTNHPLCRDGTEVRYEHWTNLYRTDRRFAYITMHFNNADVKATVVRTKNGTPKAGMYYINGFYGPFIQFPAMVNDGFLYTIGFESLPPGKNFTIRMQDDYVAGDEILFRIKDFGRLDGIKLDGRTQYNSVDALRAANGDGYAVVGNYFYFKLRSVSTTPDRSYSISWTGNITLPMLDTDGDGQSDAQESIAGTDPIENDPIPTNPVLTIPSADIPPVVGMTSPQEGEQFVLGETITLQATATDADGSIQKVNFKVDRDYYSQDVSDPYTGSFTPTSSGTYFLSARAFDNDNLIDEKGVTITVVDNTPDCEGTPGGNVGPGAACNDGDPCTINDTYDNNCNCVGELVVPEVTTSADNEYCDNPGAIYFNFADAESRTNIEFSLDGGNSYPLNVADDLGQATFDNVTAGTYDLWSRWGNDECPVGLGEITIEPDPEPAVTVEMTQPSQANNSGTITFSFEDTPRWRIEFSMDGGASYPLNVIDNEGNASFEDVVPGTYDLWSRWGDDECPVDVGLVTIHELPEITFSRPLEGTTFDEGEAVLVDVLATNENVIAKIELSLDGEFVRSESVAPYNWNQTEQPQDEVFNTLSIGEHTLTAKATSVEGLTYEVSINITIEALPRDCHGDINGTAYRDECDQCVGGNTGETACEQDCHGDWGGTAAEDDCGFCSGGNTGVPVNDCITSVGIENKESIQIYPNPTLGKVYLSKEVSWRLIDVYGTTVMKGHDTALDISAYPAGVYLLMVEGQTYQVVKQ